MADIIALNKARKARTRATKRAEADENAVKFGQSKAERSLLTARAKKARRDLDGHERE
ncbi:MAG: DUF4169 family protein [Pseudorhodobacter sp.]|nr:DUF4169 family protein [Pseudorhodobacter sp.]